ELRDDLRDRHHLVDLSHALARAPDVAPDLLLHAAAGAEVHLRGIGPRQVLRVETGRHDALLEVVAVHAGKQVRVDDVGRGGLDDLFLVALGHGGLGRGEEARADVGEVRARGLRGEDAAAGGYRAGQQDGAVEEAAYLAYQRKRRKRARMA